MRLAPLAIALPLAEIAAFVVIGRWIGVLPVLGLVVIAALAGVLLMKSTGPATAARVQSAMRGRENPLLAVGSAAFRVVAGILLVVPGFITDILAILLLLPPVQAVLVQRVTVRGRMRRPAGGRIIEGEAVEISPPPADGSGWTRH